ncbi:non-ribosomal peptide synthetase/type I polyketide synthase [Candidatus Tisiphia endosymbiont of Ptychoptera albimana]
MIVSKDGHCRPFDNEASGTISGSGVGVVLLKRLSDAIKDGDRILAVIKGYATNNDGDRKISYTSPSIIGQAECIINAQRMAGLLSDSLDYIETHGTGTNIGDPIEIQALNQAFHYNKSNEERLTKCILGAVKANIGHCNSAAGIAGLIKICKMLEDRIIPKQINYVHANQELSLDKTNFDIITANRKWLPRDDKPRIAGVSSFGIGGTNAHVIISEFISDTSLQNKAQLNNNDYNITVNNPLVYILPITAKTKKSLIEYKKEFIKYLKDTNDDISDIAYTLEQRREHFNYRYVISCNSLPNAIKKLESNDEIIKVSDKIISQNLKNIFMFPGQGSQYIDMGFELYQNDEDFKSIIDNCIEIIKKQSDIDIGLILFPRLYGKVEEDINLTKWAQPSLFIISYALARLLNKIGITAEAYIGHSIGEYVAATLSGVFSLESALKLVMARGRLMQEMPAGKMLSIQASVDEIAKYVEQNNCEVAVINSNTNCVVSGLELDINKLKAKLNKLSITSLILNTSHAYHSCTMEEAAKRFIKEFDRVTINKPKTKFISNVTGEFIQDKEAISPLYWANQIRKQVQFAKGVDTIFNYYNGDVVFIEAGPGRSLNSFVQQYKEVRSNEIISIQLMRSLKEQGSKQNIKNKEDILSILWFNGFAVNLNKYTSPQVVLLPTYQFDYKSYWIKESRINNFKHNKLNPLNDMFYAREWKRIGKLMISNNYRNLAKKNILIFNNENNSDYIDQLVFKISLITKNFKYIKNSLGEYIEDGNSVSLNLSNQLHINKLKKLMNDQFDTTIYFSSGIRDNAINSDISAAYYLNMAIYKNLTEVHQFISISCNNYDVLGDETLAQFPSVVPGITKSLPIENSNLNATHYDINFESDVEEILKFLASIIDNKYESNLVVVRNKYLWVPIYKKISLNTIIHKPLVKDGDSILISGGLGGIGYSLAQYINTIANDLNIILIGRTDQLTLSRKYRTNLTMLKDIRKNNIFYISCDIGNLDCCNLLINKLQQLNIAKLNLVIHAAGIGAKSAIEVKEISDIYAVTDPKIQGMINIIKISKQLSLGTIITCSSLSTIVPSYGNMEYTAANLFLDEISYRKYLNIDKIITVNFNQISDVGMAFEFISKNKNNPSLNSICSGDIPNIIDIINNTKNLNHIILSKYDIEKQLLDIEEQLLVNKYTCNLVKEDNQAIIIVEKNFTELEYKLAQIFCATLCLDEISLHDDFFRLGGNSILAIRLVNKINRALNSNINISSIFKYNTVERLAHYLERSNKDNVLIEKIIVTRVEEQKLSFAQERLWFIEKYEEGTNAYNIPMLYKLSADINLDTLEISLKAVVARHEILRTLIKENTEGLGYQLVLDNTKDLLEINKISTTSKIELETELQKAVNYVYDLSNEIPIRVCFYYLQPNKEYYTSIVVHHIAFDGWSTNVFFNELQEYYNYYLAKLKGFETKLNLPDITIQYRDFALWQRNYLSGDRLDDQLNYWRSKLENYETLNLVTDKQRLKQVNYSGKNIYFEIDKGVSISLRELAKELKVSLYSVLLSAYYLMLRVYSNQDDIVIGTAVSNRHYNQVESLIGFFVNTIVLRTQIRSTSTIKEFIETVSKEVIEAQLHQDLPFEKLVEELQVEKDTSRHPIFQVMFGLQNFGFNTKLELLQGYVSDTNLYNVAKFDIETFIDDSQEILRGGFNYAVSLYTEETINRLKDTYLEIVEQISNCQVEEKISDIGYLNKEEYKRIVYGWNDTGKEYPCDKTIHGLFEEQIERSPDSIALVYEDIYLSYREVNERANKLAHYIRIREEIEPDTLIALCLDRSEHMLISILAVLKTGGAYVPMDPGYPDSRIEYIVNDTRAKVLLTNSVYQERLDGIGANTNVIAVDSAEVQEALVTASIFSPVTRIESMNLAYVIYTSGTTGNPKGVMIGHRGVVSLVKNSEYVNIDSDDSLIQFADMAFDATTFEIWGSLLNGAKLFIPSNKVGLVTDINLFYETLITNKVSILWLTKTLFDQLFLINESIFKNINYLLIGGESLNKGLISRLIDSNNVPQNIINGYGPTENTTFSCTLNINKDNIKVTDSIPIGIPLVNRKAYILNSNLTPLPIGAIGELYVGGVGLARGYLNRADLTAEKFIANPFRTEEELRQGKNARLYRTGDLARLLPDGNLEYIGRNDSQVKIRGYRIELGEIESALLLYEGIKQSVVVAREHVSADDSTGNKYLVGYYVSEHKLKESDILTYLESKLPEYMVPSTLVHLEKLPLTINGKLDRKALPDTEFTDKDNYLAPRNELEAKVCQIWAEVLGIEVDKVGIHDNFFRLGGNSILAIRLVSKLGKELNRNISIGSIFKSHSIERLIEYLKDNAESGTNISKVSISNAEKQKLSFAQERLWFIEKYEEGTNAYNIPMLYKLSADINLDTLEMSLKAVVARHEILRTLIKENTEGLGYQLVLDNTKNLLEINKISITSKIELETELQKAVNYVYDLSNEIPIRVCFYYLQPNKEYYTSIVVHHIAFDGWSTNIFFNELQEYYNYYLAKLKGLEAKLNLPDITIQYRDFALWQRNYLSGDRLDSQLNYWRSKLENYETLNLVTDKQRLKQVNYSGKNIYFEIDKGVSISLRELAKELKVSLYSVLLSAYYLMLRVYSNQDDIVIGTAVSNRHYNKVESLIGFFVNTIVLRTQIRSTSTIKEFIETVSKEVIEAQLHQDLPFEKLVEELQVEKDTSRHPIFQVMFGLQNFGFNTKSELLQGYVSDTNLYNVAKFDIETFIDDSQEILRGGFNYAVSLYTEETINRLKDTYLEIVKQISNCQVEEKISDIGYLNKEEYERIVYGWNDTGKEYPCDKTIHRLFEEQVEKSPDSIALVYEDIHLSYREVNERANKLAHYIRSREEIEPDTLIALCLDRSEHMLISILAVLKAGGAYVPMDPGYPDSRIEYIVNDTRAKVLLTNSVYQERLDGIDKGANTNVIAVDSAEVQEALVTASIFSPVTRTESTNLAYVIYTSGTTGNPKGVMIGHRGVVNTIASLNDVYDLKKGNKITAFTSYIFDVSVSEFFTALFRCGEIHLLNDAIRSDSYLISSYVRKNNINYVYLPPILLSNLPKVKYKALCGIIYAGEPCDINTGEYWSNHYKLYNYYGPTEVTIYASGKKIKNGDTNLIGKPISNTNVYILDNNLTPLPIGAIGELYVGGVGLARGYLNRADLTAEKFIANPFRTEEELRQGKNARLYRTGDLARLLPDGNSEYIGRNDSQVKIRGYRIELGEIESALLSYEDIKQSVVVTREYVSADDSTSNKYLVGYYVSEHKLKESDILTYLESKLPEYMVPNILVHLEKLPLTVNGKLDKQALPYPEFGIDIDSYVAPRSELESKVCSIWGEILNLSSDKIGIHDNFFKLGGNSFTTVKLITKINKNFGTSISIQDIFLYPTISQIAKVIESTEASNLM